MAEKFNNDSSLSPQELARHLKHPDGEIGKQVAFTMNRGNKHFCLHSYEMLDPGDNQEILEIGMGNGFFVKDLLSMAKGIKYTGADYSPTMVNDSIHLNRAFIDDGSARFLQASIDSLPFNEDSFDRITTTNTIYFWPDPARNALELLRILKPGGMLMIAYRSKSFLDNIEFAKHGFMKYDTKDVERLLIKSGYHNIQTKMINEPELDFDGTVFQIQGYYTTAFK